jgi:hypothetical protein
MEHTNEYLKTFCTQRIKATKRVCNQSLVEVLIDPTKGDVTKFFINRMRVANLIGFIELNEDIETFTVDDIINIYEHEFKEQAPGASTVQNCLRCSNYKISSDGRIKKRKV